MEFGALFWFTMILLGEAVIMGTILASRNDLVVMSTMSAVFGISNIVFFCYALYMSKYIKMRSDLRLYLTRFPDESMSEFDPEFANTHVEDISEHDITMKARK